MDLNTKLVIRNQTRWLLSTTKAIIVLNCLSSCTSSDQLGDHLVSSKTNPSYTYMCFLTFICCQKGSATITNPDDFTLSVAKFSRFAFTGRVTKCLDWSWPSSQPEVVCYAGPTILPLTIWVNRKFDEQWPSRRWWNPLFFSHFFETNVKATDETWYKRAVDQYAVEPDSFVYSVPFDVGTAGKSLVTATHAVFIEHKGHRAPAAVVGLQYLHSSLAAHFVNITSAVIINYGIG